MSHATRWLVIAIAALIGLTLAAIKAHAAPQCAPHAAVVAGLAKKYSETVVAMGMTGIGTMIEVFASPSGTWTIVQTEPRGISCLMASGGYFETVRESLPPEGIPG